MAMPKDFVPKREADLDEFVHNFATRTSATPTSFGLTALQATAFEALVTAWDTAYAVTKNRGTRSQSAVIVKDEAKFLMVKKLRELARIVQAFPGTTNEQRSLLGLTVPCIPQSNPAPGSVPQFIVAGVYGNSVRVKLRDSTNPSRLRPDFAKSASVFSYVGTTPPTGAEGWFYQGGTTRNTFDIVFDSELPMGTKVFLCAFWKNERDMSGPTCQPVEVTLLGSAALPGGYQKATDEGMSLAA